MLERLAKLIKELRIAKVGQTRGLLRYDYDGAAHFCALGYAAEVFRKETGKGCWTGSHFYVGGHSQAAYDDVPAWFGLTSQDTSDIWNMNDSGSSFSQIADMLERRYGPCPLP